MSNRDFESFDSTSNEPQRPETDTASARDRLYDASSRIKDRAADLGRMAGEKLGDTRTTAADTLGRTATQIRDSSATMSNQTMGRVTSKVADGLERGSMYLRTGGMDQARTDVEGMVRSRPAESILGALAVGFIVGKLFTRR
jgi:ElaB/YqjD/DUF883 family membrane-anchored ribosome-binding protein